MDRRGAGRTLLKAAVGAGLLLLPLPPDAPGGTTGKIAGRIVDKGRRPLVGVNVAVPAARAGAMTDENGRYVVVNVPAGAYEMKVGLLGYRAVTVLEVVVSADNTTVVDLTLEESPIPLAEVVVTAERPVVDLKLTSSLAALSREDIRSLPVQELQEVVDLQAGVVDGHFRGGRLGEVQVQVDGVTVNNAYDNRSSLRLDRSLLEEVQVISGTFDAEYGQAMSGVVNAVMRRGTDRFVWDAEAYAGGFFFPGNRGRIVDFDFRPGAQQYYQFGLSGPTPLPKTFFLASGRRHAFDDYVRATRRFRPTDSSDFARKIFRPTGDGSEVSLGYSREWSGFARLTNRSLPDVEIGYQAIFGFTEARRLNWAYRFNPDGLAKQRTLSLVHGPEWTHTLSRSSYYTLSARHNVFDYRDLLYDDVGDLRYDAAGRPIADDAYEPGAVIQGADFTRFRQTTDAFLLKGSFVSQMSSDLQLKVGGEVQWPIVRFGVPGHLVFTTVDGVERLVRRVDEPPHFPGVQKYHPLFAAAFAQQEVEWNDVRIRAGARFDHFDARATLPSDLANPANSIAGAPASRPVSTTARSTLSPRIGVSYPVTRDAALFFAYGHFTQMPAIGQFLADADYTVLRDLQASSTTYRVMGNPDIKPERTVQYQFGYRQALAEWLGFDVDVFYKDIRDLLGVEFISTYNDAEYARLTNVDFGTVVGFTVSLDQRRRGIFSTRLDYTWQLAQGNSSDPRETATRAAAGQDPRPRVVPFDWDQRHTLNLTLMASRPDAFFVSAIARVASGQPYTPQIETGFGASLEANSGRKPVGTLVDVRAERDFRAWGLDLAAFGRIFNLFDSRFFNDFVFGTSGSPYYSRFPTADRVVLADPTRFRAPRRIEVGLTMRGGR